MLEIKSGDGPDVTSLILSLCCQDVSLSWYRYVTVSGVLPPIEGKLNVRDYKAFTEISLCKHDDGTVDHR